MNQELLTIKTDHLAGFAKQFTNIQRASDVFSSLHLPIKTFIDEQNKQAEMLKQAFQPLNDLQNALNLSHIRTLGNITTPATSLARLTENKAFPATPAPKRKPIIIDHEPISPSDTPQTDKQTDAQSQALAVSVTHLPPAETEPRKSRKQLQRENIALQTQVEVQEKFIKMLMGDYQARSNEPLTKANQTIDDQQKQIETLQAEIDRLQALVGATATPANNKELSSKSVGAVARLIYVLLKMNDIENDTQKGKGKANDIIQAESRLHLKTELSRDFIADWLKHAKEVEYKQKE